MSLNSQTSAPRSEDPRKLRHLFLRPISSSDCREYIPRFYIEAKIDFADVRSGCNVTRGMNQVLDILPFDGDLLWTPDMVLSIDPGYLESSPPPQTRLADLPEFITPELLSRVETRYVTYLLRHAEIRIFRNFALNAYSHPGESRAEFQARCAEIFSESFRREIDELREVVNRRLARIEERYLGYDRSGEFEWDRRFAQARSRLHAVSESIAELFLRTELTPDEFPAGRRVSHSELPDMEQRLENLEIDIRDQIRRLLSAYQEKVRNIDEYIIHPNLRDIHIVRTCILWIPSEDLA